MIVTTNILQRTFRLTGSQTGTCFTVDVDSRQYIVTARHLVSTIGESGTVTILKDRREVRVPVQLVGHGKGGADVSVLAAPLQLSPTHRLLTTTAGMAIGQDVCFLGFPYGLATDVGSINRHFPIPLIKRAIVSGMVMESDTLLLDGHNNRGFSGGPIVYYQRNDPSGDPTAVGVVSGFRYAWEPVYEGEDQTGLRYKHNTGIVLGYGIKHVTDLIVENPIGFELARGGA